MSFFLSRSRGIFRRRGPAAEEDTATAGFADKEELLNLGARQLSGRMILYRSPFRAIETFHTGFPEPLA